MRVFAYCRKSTDTEDKQVLSIESQVEEVKRVAERHGVTLIETFIEKMSAKNPGRPIFNEMLKRIQLGEAEGIVCWKLDRLARNPIDGGQIQWVLQNNVLKSILTPFGEYKPADNVILMAVEFGMANQFIINLSSDVKRGHEAALRNGKWTRVAPFGYAWRNGKVVPHSKKSLIVKRAYELYSSGQFSIPELIIKLKDYSFEYRGKMAENTMARILKSKFYYGVMEVGGKEYAGSHKPIVSKKLYDEVQNALKEKRARKNQKHNFVFRGNLKCGECGCSITAELQKGNVYYRCAKRRGKCTQRFVREDRLQELLIKRIQGIKLPLFWVDLAIESIREENSVVIEAQRARRKMALDEIDRIERMREGLLTMRINREISGEDFTKRDQAFQVELTASKDALEGIGAESNDYLEEAHKMFELLENGLEKLKTATPEQYALLGKFLCSNFTILDREIVKHEYVSHFKLLAYSEKYGSAHKNVTWWVRRGQTSNFLGMIRDFVEGFKVQSWQWNAVMGKLDPALMYKT